ncbi:MAG TPA: helix-turn-helix domain-containing protein, partial [Polyangiaceae bacterium]
MAKKTLSLDQAAARLRLTPDAVLAMIRSRRLVGVLVDGVWRVASADVDALLRPPTGYCPP